MTAAELSQIGTAGWRFDSSTSHRETLVSFWPVAAEQRP